MRALHAPHKFAIAVSRINSGMQGCNLAYSGQAGPPAVLERSGASTGADPPEGGRSGDGGEVEINESAAKENADKANVGS